MKRDFWKSSGIHLLEKQDNGWLQITPDYLRAYYTRPEVHPIDTSCRAENQLFEQLMEDPFSEVQEATIAAIEDTDAADNYRILLSFRELLLKSGTLEQAYLKIMQSGNISIPPIFIDQMVHIILRNILDNVQDPFQVKMAELFFREQKINTDEGQIMLADEEVIEMYREQGGAGGLGQLLIDSDTPLKSVELDILDDRNKDSYWARSDRYDMVVDFRFTKPSCDAFARVVEKWVKHLLAIKIKIQPRQSISDEQWSWHIGLDRESTTILNGLYENKEVISDDNQRLIGLFHMTIEEQLIVIDGMRGKPVYLGLAMNEDNQLKMKPQNILLNLPLAKSA